MKQQKNIKNTMDNSKVAVSFTAINPFLVDNIVKPEENEFKAQGWVEFGQNNIYPNYIYELYQSVPTLQSVINGTVDYIVGDDVVSNIPALTNKDAIKLVKDMAQSITTFGGVYMNVLRNAFTSVAKVDVLDYRNVRSSLKNELFYYSPDFSNGKSYGRCKTHLYPAFNPEDKDVASSIYYWKNQKYTTYALPFWGASTIACETEKKINEFNFNEICNSFMGNVLVSLNNGVPDQEQQREIEKNFREKFTGSENAGRVVIAYSNDKEHSPEITQIESANIVERYQELQKRSREQIFTAFRANPNLFGLNTYNTGFNTQEYKSAYALFNKTVVSPIQDTIKDIIDCIFGAENAIEIIPFTIKFEE